MGAAPIVLALVGLVIPIAFVLLAIVFDVGMTVWLAYQLWHDKR